MHNEYSDLFTVRCFKGMYLLQIKDDSKPYQVTTKHVAYALQEPFRKDLIRLKAQQILAPLGIDDTVK